MSVLTTDTGRLIRKKKRKKKKKKGRRSGIDLILFQFSPTPPLLRHGRTGIWPSRMPLGQPGAQVRGGYEQIGPGQAAAAGHSEVSPS